jgi:hypothetical protein
MEAAATAVPLQATVADRTADPHRRLIEAAIAGRRRPMIEVRLDDRCRRMVAVLQDGQCPRTVVDVRRRRRMVEEAVGLLPTEAVVVAGRRVAVVLAEDMRPRQAEAEATAAVGAAAVDTTEAVTST